MHSFLSENVECMAMWLILRVKKGVHVHPLPLLPSYGPGLEPNMPTWALDIIGNKLKMNISYVNNLKMILRVLF